MMRERIFSFGNNTCRLAGLAQPRRLLAIALGAAFTYIGLVGLAASAGQAVAQHYGPAPLRPLAPVLSEAVAPDALAGAIDPDTMRELNEASADELFSGGRAAFEDGRHQDAQIFFEHLVARFSRSDEAVKARRYLAALYATLPEPAASRTRAGSATGEHAEQQGSDRRAGARAMARGGIWMLGGDMRERSADGRSPRSVDAEFAASPAGSQGAGFARVSSEFSASSQYQNSVDDYLTNRLRLDVGDRVFFSAGSADLGARARGVLSGQAKWLIDRPNVNAVVAGHADEQGSPQLNIEISALRAQVVRSRLIEEGVRAERIAVAALGRNEPVSPCQSAACATHNRRAVLVIVNARGRSGDWQPARPRQNERPLPDSPRAW